MSSTAIPNDLKRGTSCGYARHLGTRNRLDSGVTDPGHLLGKLTATLLVQAVDLHAPNLAHLADGLELCARLLAGAEQAHFAGIHAGHEFTGHAAGRAGTH